MRRFLLPLVVVLIAVAMVFAVVLGMDTESESYEFDAPAAVADVEVLPPGVVDLEHSAELVDNRRPTAPAESEQHYGSYRDHGQHLPANITRTGRSLGVGVYAVAQRRLPVAPF